MKSRALRPLRRLNEWALASARQRTVDAAAARDGAQDRRDSALATVAGMYESLMASMSPDTPVDFARYRRLEGDVPLHLGHVARLERDLGRFEADLAAERREMERLRRQRDVLDRRARTVASESQVAIERREAIAADDLWLTRGGATR